MNRRKKKKKILYETVYREYNKKESHSSSTKIHTAMEYATSVEIMSVFLN